MTEVRCEVRGVYVAVNAAAPVPLVVLADGTGRVLPIFIGIWEAVSINSARNHEVLPRPFTHDLFIDVLTKFGVTLRTLHIDSIEEGVYYARLTLGSDHHEEVIELSSQRRDRPCTPGGCLNLCRRRGLLRSR